jgi:hypothetical protein
MPIKARLLDPRGNSIQMLLDPHNVLHRILPASEDSAFDLLNRIDWYDTTDFRSQQMDQFLAELDRVSSRASLPEEREYLVQLRAVAAACKAEPQCRLRFIGD